MPPICLSVCASAILVLTLGCSKKSERGLPPGSDGARPPAASTVEFGTSPSQPSPAQRADLGSDSTAAQPGRVAWITSPLSGEMDGVWFNLAAGSEVRVLESAGGQMVVAAQGQEWEVAAAVVSTQKPAIPTAPPAAGPAARRLLRIDGRPISPKGRLLRTEAAFQDQADQARAAVEGLARSGGDAAEITRFQEAAERYERQAERTRLIGLGASEEIQESPDATVPRR